MFEDENVNENIHNEPYLLDLRTEQKGGFLPTTIRVSSDMIGVNKWAEMVEKTQAKGIECGVIVSFNGKRLFTSKVFEGLGEGYNYDGNGKHPPSFNPPLFPHGLRSLSPRMKDVVLIHTHPIPGKIDHLPTTTMSGTDILTYVNSTYNALVMVDRGGIHILTGRNPYRITEEIPTERIMANAFNKSKSNSKTVAEVIVEIAKSLKAFGIQYYFSPYKTPSNERFVVLSDSSQIEIPTLKA